MSSTRAHASPLNRPRFVLSIVIFRKLERGSPFVPIAKARSIFTYPPDRECSCSWTPHPTLSLLFFVSNIFLHFHKHASTVVILRAKTYQFGPHHHEYLRCTSPNRANFVALRHCSGQSSWAFHHHVYAHERVPVLRVPAAYTTQIVGRGGHHRWQ